MKPLKLTLLLITAIFLAPALRAAPAAAGVRSAVVAVDGMSCPFCAFGVEKKLKEVSGVKSVTVDLKGGKARMDALAGKTIRISEIPAAIRQAGFTPGVIEVVIVGPVKMDRQGGWFVEDDRSKEVYRLQDPGKDLQEQLYRLAKEGHVRITGIFHPPQQDARPTITPQRVRKGGPWPER